MRYMSLKMERVIYLPAAFFLLLHAGCLTTSGDLEAEIRSLMDNQFSASGSDLAQAVCGWQPSEKISIKEMKVYNDPYGSGNSGLGNAFIKAEGKGFRCSGNISFHYNKAYAGGHGYGSGYSSLALGLISRESDVPESVSNNVSAKKIVAGVAVDGLLSDKSLTLPDGSYAEWYYLEIDEPEPALEVTVRTLDRGSSPRCFIYQNNRLVSTDSSTGFGVKKGRVILMISAGKEKCAYSLLPEMLSEKEKSVLKK